MNKSSGFYKRYRFSKMLNRSWKAKSLHIC